VERVNQVSFVKALPILRRRVGNFVCISKFVADDLESYFAEYSEEPKKKITHFLLGSDFRISDRKHLDPVREEIAAIFSGVSVWLAVGTIEPRKNHGFILDAFDEIWSSGRLDRLLIIGRVGWMCEDVIERILGHREFNKKLFFKNDIVDHELRYAYEAAKGLIFASPIEGFGLPIVEAMAANIRVFCSDIPVFREVGGDYPSYFSLDEASNLTRLIGAAPVERPPSHSAEANIVNWDTSVAEFAAKVLHIDNR
jgi:alpha-1,2-rhamnosyltransferase